MTYTEVLKHLSENSYQWTITGGAGFIGSHLVETLLQNNQQVIVLDNFSTGYESNLNDIKTRVSTLHWQKFHLLRGDITSFEDCKKAVMDSDFVLHHAAMGSVPRSIERPLEANKINVDGFLNILQAATLEKVKRFIYASSSAVYGDNETLPKKESDLGRLLSPYAASKRINELYAESFSKNYGIETMGLRYFNVFGPRQDPNGAYAAVIPKWIQALAENKEVHINGDGTTSRDFCFVKDVVQINLLAALTTNPESLNQVYNCGTGKPTSLTELFKILKSEFKKAKRPLSISTPELRPFREGDVVHSVADISLAQKKLQFQPEYDLGKGLQQTISFFTPALAVVTPKAPQTEPAILL
ncbi:MAG: SDR family oxidoreductase [Bdellovibrionales bacterium]